MRKIQNIKDVREVGNVIIGKLVKGSLAYFNLIVADLTGDVSNAFFTPTSKISEKKSMIFVSDYEKVMMLLLSHPKVSDLEYNEEENAVTAVFNNPYIEENQDEF